MDTKEGSILLVIIRLGKSKDALVLNVRTDQRCDMQSGGILYIDEPLCDMINDLHERYLRGHIRGGTLLNIVVSPLKSPVIQPAVEAGCPLTRIFPKLALGKTALATNFGLFSLTNF